MHLGIVATSAVVATVLGACSPCENKIAREIQSGAGMRAVVFDRGCGATTGFSTQVSILAGNEKLPDDGGNAVVLGGKDMIADIHWDTPKKLSIEIKSDAKVFSKQARVESVDLVYPR